MGQLFWEAGLETVFVDVVSEIVAALNDRGKYPLRLVGPDRHDTLQIGPVRGIHAGDLAAVACAISGAEFASTAVGVAALPHVVGPIAAGVRRRVQEGKPPLNVLLCENQLHCADLVRGLLSHHLSQAELRQIGLIETVVGRMVPVVPARDRAGDPLLAIAEDYVGMPIDRFAIIGSAPAVPALQLVDEFAFYVERKLYVHNMGHAAAGYLGYRRGLPTIHAVMEDAAVAEMVGSAMSAAGEALCRKHSAPRDEMRTMVADLARRFRNAALDDSVDRVARDPIRKLRVEDRLIGALLCCLDQGVEAVGIPDAIAAAITYDNAEDPSATRLQALLATEGLDAVLQNVCGLAPDGEAAGLIRGAFDRTESPPLQNGEGDGG